MRTRARWLSLGLVAVMLPSLAWAYFLDSERRFDVRLRAYSQVGFFARDNQIDEPPFYEAGTVFSNRNFWNPELDMKLTDFTTWMANVPGLSVLQPDDFKVRAAGWGFYDGMFDYTNEEWDAQRRGRLVRLAWTDTPGAVSSRKFNDNPKNLRDTLAHESRLNELYFDYTRGPFFLRVGKQTISWGESDSIALLDVQNPFDLRNGAPGFFQDVDEARIPLWTIRSTIKLLDNWKALSSVFGDIYLVPGPIDTTVPVSPTWFGQPYSAPGNDPQRQNLVPQFGLPAPPLHVDIVDKYPTNNWSNSRWGARLTGVVARDYTVQGWFFRTFPVQPTPLLLGPSAITEGTKGHVTLIDSHGRRISSCLDASGNQIPAGFGQVGRTPAGRPCGYAAPVITTLNRRLESVVGLASTWYSQPLNGIVRLEGEYFSHEQAFIPDQNINPEVQLPGSTIKNHIPTANYLRWTIGYDRFFFARFLNPVNSFVLSGAFNGSWNISEGKDGQDFRFPTTRVSPNNTLLPNSCSGVGVAGYKSTDARGRVIDERVKEPTCTQAGGRVPNNYWYDQKELDGTFFQVALQTDYMHGRLTPRFVSILDVRGTYAFTLSATYRITDYLLFSGSYLTVISERLAGLGTFKDRDQFLFRMTYQLN